MPMLGDRGFSFDGSRTFRRSLSNGTIAQLVNFQLGQRSQEGRFTVNLGVFVLGELLSNPPAVTASNALEHHCSGPRRTRLGTMHPGLIPALANVPLVGALLGPKDVWWPFVEDQGRTDTSLRECLLLLERHGFAWLAQATPRGASDD
ncbi:MAG: hypothetical protein IPK12_22030 [Gemmatimonadetes bacterium]|nr:hypothetical protein [Gemmatimonadota bacterium]